MLYYRTYVRTFELGSKTMYVFNFKPIPSEQIFDMSLISKTENGALNDSVNTEGDMLEEANKLLNDISKFSLNLHALKTALQRMESFLINLSLIPKTCGEHHYDDEIKNENKKKSQGDAGHEVITIKNQVASSLLRLDRVVTSSSANIKLISMSSSLIEREIFAILEKCLDLCGTKTIFLASNQCLMEASQCKSSSSSSSKPDLPPSSVLLSIRTLKRILLPRPFSDLSTTRKSFNFNRTDSDRTAEWFESIQLLLNLLKPIFTLPSNTSEHTSSISMSMKTINEIDDIARIIVMLPVRIASALHSSQLSSSLPSWATRTNYFPRIIHTLFAATLSCHSITTTISDSENTRGGNEMNLNLKINTNNAECIEILLKSVFKLMLCHGGADDIALGSFNTYLLLEANLYNSNKCNVKHASAHSHQFKHLLSRCIIQLTTPRESAKLLRSFLLCISAFCFDSLFRIPKGSIDAVLLATDIFFQNQKLEYTQRKLTKAQHKEKFNLMIPYLDTFCLPTLHKSPGIRDAIINSLILSPSPADCIDITISWSIASLLYKCAYSTDMIIGCNSQVEINTEIKLSPVNDFTSYLQEVSEIWSQTTFINHTDLAPQEHVTNFIINSLSLLTKPKNNNPHNDFSGIIEMLVRGVTIRLESSILDVRNHGMRVAESFAVLVGQPLSFEELRKHEKDEGEIKDGLSNKIMQENYDISNSVESQNRDHKIATSKTSKSSQKKTKQKKIYGDASAIDVDPDDEYISDEQSNVSCRSSINSDNGSEGSSWDSSFDEDDEFVPFDLTDNEQDLFPVPAPFYLTECLSMLRSPESDKETYDRHHISLKTLPALLKSFPPDLPDLAIPLTNDILHLENKFDMPNFEGMRMDCLIQLIISEPILLGEYLVKEKVFEDGLSLSTRLEVLEILATMSEKLCGSEELKNIREEQNLR